MPRPLGEAEIRQTAGKGRFCRRMACPGDGEVCRGPIKRKLRNRADLRGCRLRRKGPRGLRVCLPARRLHHPRAGPQGYGHNPSEEAAQGGAEGHEGEENHKGIATSQEASIQSAIAGDGSVVVDSAAGPDDTEEINKAAEDSQEVSEKVSACALFGFYWRFGLLTHRAVGMNS